MKSKTSLAKKTKTPARTRQAASAQAVGGCTCAKLRRTARRVTQSYERFLQASGLKITQFSLLGNLRHGDALSVSALADRMATDRTTLTRNLKPLVDAGLVAVPEGPDRRTRAVVITPAGKAAYRTAVPHWKKAQENLIDTLGEDLVVQLHELLDRSMARMDEA